VSVLFFITTITIIVPSLMVTPEFYLAAKTRQRKIIIMIIKYNNTLEVVLHIGALLIICFQSSVHTVGLSKEFCSGCSSSLDTGIGVDL